MPSTKPNFYARSKKSALVAFTANRGIAVRSTAKSSNTPLKKDYVNALRVADTSRTFDFLELPPELRNNIYRELLILRHSWTCQAQVLRTCKQINDEASNILYGDNLIEIKIFGDGIYTHGKRCGDYEFEYNHPPHGNRKKGTEIQWPHFLRKAQFLRLSVERPQVQLVQGQRMVPRLGALHFVLHSLCLFLSGKHQLRSLVVDLSQLQDLFQLGGVRQHFDGHIGTTLYPLRLLESIKDLRVYGILTTLTTVLIPRSSTLEMADKILAGSAWFIMKNIRLAWSTYCSILIGGRLGNALEWIGSIATYIQLLFEGSDVSKGLLQNFLRDVEVLRVILDRVPTEMLTDQCKKQIDELVRLEVEVQLAMRRGDEAESGQAYHAVIH